VYGRKTPGSRALHMYGKAPEEKGSCRNSDTILDIILSIVYLRSKGPQVRDNSPEVVLYFKMRI
jgi:hypothetical protein